MERGQQVLKQLSSTERGIFGAFSAENYPPDLARDEIKLPFGGSTACFSGKPGPRAFSHFPDFGQVFLLKYALFS